MEYQHPLYAREGRPGMNPWERFSEVNSPKKGPPGLKAASALKSNITHSQG